MEHQVKEVKISTTLYSINHCQNENISKTAVTFLVFDSMFVNSYWTTVHKSCEILFLYYIFHKPTFQTLLQLSGFSI